MSRSGTFCHQSKFVKFYIQPVLKFVSIYPNALEDDVYFCSKKFPASVKYVYFHDKEDYQQILQ